MKGRGMLRPSFFLRYHSMFRGIEPLNIEHDLKQREPLWPKRFCAR